MSSPEISNYIPVIVGGYGSKSLLASSVPLSRYLILQFAFYTSCHSKQFVSFSMYIVKKSTKSTPMVLKKAVENLSSQYRDKIQDLPTPESPIISSLRNY